MDVRIRQCATADLSPSDVTSIRTLLATAFAGDGEGFTDDDWSHAMGGTHVVAAVDGEVVVHAAVVERTLHVAGRPLQSGYVEAVATAPSFQGRGLGTKAMLAVAALIEATYDLGALSTGSHGFYERLGWLRWEGPSFVLTTAGTIATPEDDGSLMVLPTPRIPGLDRTAPIACPWRPGDVW